MAVYLRILALGAALMAQVKPLSMMLSFHIVTAVQVPAALLLIHHFAMVTVKLVEVGLCT